MNALYRKLTRHAAPWVLAFAATACGGNSNTSQEWREIDDRYTYSGNDLGMFYNSATDSAEFKLWAPTADKVEMIFFSAADHNIATGTTHSLIREKQDGVWSTEITAADIGVARLKGVFYQYLVDGKPALDPYARSMAVNNGSTGKAAIVDPDSFNVSAYADIDGFEKREDAIIYEVHLRDFTVDPDIEAELDDRRFGTFSAFVEKLDYIQALGVTHVQFLPLMAYYYGDEGLADQREWEWRTRNSNYNWGYDPHSYFSPDGFYASDPANPQARVDELKQLIEAIHTRGMGVILDVVYNHHPHRNIFDHLVPGYYYRGRFDSGAGDDIASERKMVRKLIVDSLIYWTREYKVDGFRFDLMGLMDRETILEGYRAVSELNPEILFIGEGWRMYGGGELLMADQDWVQEQNFAAVFADEFRNIIKSGFGAEGSPRFITGGARDIDLLFRNIKGQPGNFTADDPGDSVQYIASHDNLTLHDVIALALGRSPNEATEDIHRRIRLGNTLVMVSQGIAFLHAGQEFGRSKRWGGAEVPAESTQSSSGDVFVHNSYDSSDRINHFDWSSVNQAGLARETLEYTRGLIALRKSSDAFRLGTQSLVDTNVTRIDSPDIKAEDLLLAFSARAKSGEQYFVFINADSVSRQIKISQDLSSSSVLVDAQRAGIDLIADPVGVRIVPDMVVLDPLTAVVVRK